MRTLTKIGLLALVATVAACTVKSTEAPPLSGPSELGLRLNLQLVPDVIFQDGFSQTVLNVDASGPDGRPVRGVSMKVEIVADGVALFDFGTLSAKTVVTGDDGRARVIYTAPPKDPDSAEHYITFLVTPIGNDFRGEVPRQVDLRLMPPGVVGPPNGTPIARFTTSPATVNAFDTVSFDATTSRDTDPISGQEIPCVCTYAWDFGDGSSGSGLFTTHVYRAPGNYLVSLRVTDTGNRTGQAAQSITIGASTPPTASFVFSPANPAVSQTVFFNAEASKAATGRRIVSYDWDFGTGRFASGVTVSKGYDQAGTYNVTLVVTDDAGQKGTATQSVTVGAQGTGPTAALSISPSTGNTSTTFNFDASGSRPGPSPIIEYRFSFGDNSPDVVGTSPTTSHRYLAAGSYTARVTVRDSAGRTAQATATVTVQ